MNPFNFDLPTKIHFGEGKLAILSELIQRYGWKKALVITDKRLRETQTFTYIENIMNRKECEWAVFAGVEPNPSTDIVEEAMQLQRDFQAEVVVGFGGGSSIDVSKAVAALSTNHKSISEIFGKEKIEKKLLPLIAVPTTAGTGSEVSMACVIEDPVLKMKRAIHSQKVRPMIAIEDPTLLYGVPQRVAAETGMDTLTHLIEGYVSKGATPVTDALAVDGIRRAYEWLKIFVNNRSNSEAASNMMYAALLGGVVLTFARTGLAHTLTRPFGSRMSHGLANAIALPTVMEFNLESNIGKFSKIAAIMGAEQSNNDFEKAKIAIERVRELNKQLGIPDKFSGFIQKTEIPLLAKSAYELDLSKLNPRLFSVNDLEKLYDQLIVE